MGKGPAEAVMGYHWEWHVTKPPLELPQIRQGNILLKYVIPPFVSYMLKLEGYKQKHYKQSMG